MTKLRAVLALFLVACPLAARADELIVPAGRDATLYANDGASGNGSGNHLFVGVNGRGERRRSLVYFDLQRALPAGTRVTGATLRLFLSRARAGENRVSVHRLTAAWGEGSSSAPGNEGGGTLAAEGGATWSHRLWSTTPWASPGGDFEPAASASVPVDAAGTFHSWTGPRLLADVQAWLERPAENFGWIMVGEEASADQAKRFDSRHGSPTTRPELVLTYTAPSEPSGACCLADGSCGIALDPGASCEGSYRGAGTTCGPNPCPRPTGACCTPDATATCAEDMEAACMSGGAKWLGPATSCASNYCPVVPTPFVDPLPLPAVATPIAGTAGDEARYRIAVRQAEQKLHRDLPATTIWGYDDGTGPTYPGPTLEARRGKPVEVTWVNDLRDGSGELRRTHYLPMDHCVHGGGDDVPGTVVHLHGGHVPSEFDGQPELTIRPGEETVYRYPNTQDPATLWYHDHALGITRLNVYMGLAGFYILREGDGGFDAGIDGGGSLPSGKYDVPLVIQDRSFYPDGRLRYVDALHEHVFGNTILVNGKVWPYLEVDRGKYRFRLLNGSGSRTYTLSLSTAGPFLQIGSDGGLLRAPVAKSELTLSPGERAEIIVDFASYPAGSEVVLQNTASAPYPVGDYENAIPNVMKFVVTSEAGGTAAPPSVLRAIERHDPKRAAVTRDFVLQRHPDTCGGAVWRINGRGWNDIDERPVLGTTEIWRFINRSGVTHPMHVHLVMFNVLDRQPFLVASGGTDGAPADEIVPSIDPILAESSEQGWKDTVQVNPFEIVRVIAKFEGYPGRFPYHCHILEHEDHEMMRQFETRSVCGDGLVSAPLENCEDGNTEDGDGCSSACLVETDSGTPDAGGARDAGMGPKPPEEPRATQETCRCRLSTERSSGAPTVAAGLAFLAALSRARRRRARTSCASSA